MIQLKNRKKIFKIYNIYYQICNELIRKLNLFRPRSGWRVLLPKWYDSENIYTRQIKWQFIGSGPTAMYFEASQAGIYDVLWWHNYIHIINFSTQHTLTE
jgi:hypothetical protein